MTTTDLSSITSLDDLYGVFDQLSMEGGWHRPAGPALWPEPRKTLLPHVWHYAEIKDVLDVAGRLVDEFPDGVWFFELAAVTDPAAVPDAVAAVLGITQQPGKTVAESVAEALDGRVRLLVFDNCEHPLDAVADLM